MSKKHLTINKMSGYLGELRWTDEAGPIDLTGTEIRVVEAFPEELEEAVVTIIDAVGGVAQLDIPNVLTDTIVPGKGNFIRLGIYQSGGRLRTTPRIRILQE